MIKPDYKLLVLNLFDGSSCQQEGIPRKDFIIWLEWSNGGGKSGGQGIGTRLACDAYKQNLGNMFEKLGLSCLLHQTTFMLDTKQGNFSTKDLQLSGLGKARSEQ